MSIDINLANNQAAQLLTYADQLRTAKNDLLQYKDTIISAWRGPDAKRVIASVDTQIARIDKVIKELESLSNTVQSTAASIKRQEDAAAAEARRKAEREKREREQAAARARAEKQSRVNAARENCDQALAEKEKLEKQLKEVEKNLNNSSALTRHMYQIQKAQITVLLEQAMKKLEEAQIALENAKR